VWAFLRGKTKKVPVEYAEFIIMREMGWTYWELMSTPYEVIQNIWRFMNTEAKYKEMEERKWQARQR